MRASLLVQHEAVAVERGDRVRRDLHHDIDAAREHLRHPGVGIRDRAEDHRFEHRRPVPVAFVAGDDHLGVRLPLGEHERTGPRRIPAEVGPVLLHCFGRDDQPGRISEVRQERRVGGVERELDGVLVERLRVLDGGEEEREREGPGVVVGVVLVEHPVEVELDRLSVERRAVVEADATSELEGVLGAVLADRPALRERRLDLQSPVAVAHETVVDVHEDAEVVHRGDRVRIEGFRLRDLSDHQDPGRRLCDGGRDGKDSGQESEAENPSEEVVHGRLLIGHEASPMPDAPSMPRGWLRFGSPRYLSC